MWVEHDSYSITNPNLFDKAPAVNIASLSNWQLGWKAIHTWISLEYETNIEFDHHKKGKFIKQLIPVESCGILRDVFDIHLGSV